MKLSIQYTIWVFLFVSFSAVYSGEDTYLYFSKSHIEQLKGKVNQENLSADPYAIQLRNWADALLKAGPWSIADSNSPSMSKNPNDYYSEGPYWWPDPDNPGGPYIRRDGERNPTRFIAHKRMLNKMYQATFTLILAGYLLDDSRYINHALDILGVWFIDPEKRMNPNMDYAQAIPNKSPGRGIGIIDAHRFSKLQEAFYILDLSGKWPEKHKTEIKKWFADFLKWLTTSKNGLDEKKQGNNHTTWWCTLVAAISRFTGNEQHYQSVYQYLKKDVIKEQIKKNGSMPHEEKRTRSFDYFSFNLDAFSLVMQNFFNRGLDLWGYKAGNSGSVKKAVEYFFPYASKKIKWPYQQIVPEKEKAPLFWYWAGKRFKQKQYLDIYKSKMKADKIEDIGSSNDPFLLLINLLVWNNL